MARHYGVVRGTIYPDKLYGDVWDADIESGQDTRVCMRCGKRRPETEFYNYKTESYFKTCKTCRDRRNRMRKK